MRYLQLQELDKESGANRGGLYINVDEIVVFKPDIRMKTALIYTRDGREWRVPFSVSEIIDLLQKFKEDQ